MPRGLTTNETDLELRRLEQRYVQRKNRSTWTSDAVYVDGEYVHSAKTTILSTVTSTTNSASSRRTENPTFSWSSKGPVARVKEMKGMVCQRP